MKMTKILENKFFEYLGEKHLNCVEGHRLLSINVDITKCNYEYTEEMMDEIIEDLIDSCLKNNIDCEYYDGSSMLYPESFEFQITIDEEYIKEFNTTWKMFKKYWKINKVEEKVEEKVEVEAEEKVEAEVEEIETYSYHSLECLAQDIQQGLEEEVITYIIFKQDNKWAFTMTDDFEEAKAIQSIKKIDEKAFLMSGYDSLADYSVNTIVSTIERNYNETDKTDETNEANETEEDESIEMSMEIIDKYTTDIEGKKITSCLDGYRAIIVTVYNKDGSEIITDLINTLLRESINVKYYVDTTTEFSTFVEESILIDETQLDDFLKVWKQFQNDWGIESKDVTTSKAKEKSTNELFTRVNSLETTSKEEEVRCWDYELKE